MEWRADNGNYFFNYLSADKTFDPEQAFGANSIFYLLMFIILAPGLLILLSALSNFFHLLISNIMMRRREYTLRRTHGAHTRDLWMMVSTQVCLTLLLVGIVTLVIIELGAPLLTFQANAYHHLMLDTTEMLQQAGWHIFLLLLIGIGISWLAVARVRKDSLQESLKTTTGRRPGNHAGRNILMGWQMLIGILFFTVLAGLLLQININQDAQHAWLTPQEKEEIFFMDNMTDEESRYRYMADFQTIPSVKEVIALNKDCMLLNLRAWRAVQTCDAQGDTLEASLVACNSQVLQFINTPLLQGRWSEKNDEVLIDEHFASRCNLHVGDMLKLVSDKDNAEILAQLNEYVTITGIIDNAMQMSSKNQGTNYWTYRRGGIYVDAKQKTSYQIAVKCYPGKAQECRHDFFEKQKQQGFEIADESQIETLYSFNAKNNHGEKELLPLFWLFAGIALIITMLGTYSAIHVDTSARRKEMAIRKINGAKAHHIALCFARLYIILLVVAAAIAFPLTYLFFDFLAKEYREAFNYGFLFYTCIFLLMALFVALTIGVQIWQIARINPSKIIKEE